MTIDFFDENSAVDWKSGKIGFFYLILEAENPSNDRKKIRASIAIYSDGSAQAIKDYQRDIASFYSGFALSQEEKKTA